MAPDLGPILACASWVRFPYHGCVAMWTWAFFLCLFGGSGRVLAQLSSQVEPCRTAHPLPSALHWAHPIPYPCLSYISWPFLALGEVGSPVSPWVSCSICCTAEHPEMVPWNLLARKSQQASADWPGPTILCLSNLCLSVTVGLLPASLPSLPFQGLCHSESESGL